MELGLWKNASEIKNLKSRLNQFFFFNFGAKTCLTTPQSRHVGWSNDPFFNFGAKHVPDSRGPGFFNLAPFLTHSGCGRKEKKPNPSVHLKTKQGLARKMREGEKRKQDQRLCVCEKNGYGCG